MRDRSTKLHSIDLHEADSQVATNSATSDTHRFAALVNGIQGLRVPGSKGRRHGGVPIISGLDKVAFGTQAASEVVQVCGIKPPKYLWYMISGALCDVLQFLIDYALHFYVADASACWALSFTMSIAARHTTHRYLAFGDYVGGYWRSLRRIYAGYSLTIVLSTLFNILMTRGVSFPHYVAWVCTQLWTGIVNYFILKKLWSFGGAPPSSRRQGRAFISKTSAVESSLELTEGP